MKVALLIPIAMLGASGCAAFYDHRLALELDRHAADVRACNAGERHACLEAVKWDRTEPYYVAEKQDVLRRGCALGIAEHCVALAADSRNDVPELVQRACRFGSEPSCITVLADPKYPPGARARAFEVACTSSPRECLDAIDEDLFEHQPGLVDELAARACAKDVTTCGDAIAMRVRAAAPDACFRARGDWSGCSRADSSVLRRGCAAGSDDLCFLLGKRLVQR